MTWEKKKNVAHDDDDDDVDDVDHHDHDDHDQDGYPANSPHDKIPPWWEYVNRRGGFLSRTKKSHLNVVHVDLLSKTK